jgi:hypothetical protein
VRSAWDESRRRVGPYLGRGPLWGVHPPSPPIVCH